jgi:hypothetical protein
MKLRNASENYVVPPVGRYKAKIMAAETAISGSGSGAPMIKITGEIREPTQYAGAQFFDNMITDAGYKGAGFGKKKLRGLGVPVDSEEEIQDSQIAANLLGLECWVDLDHEQINDKNPSTGEYDVPRFNMENGQRIPAMKLVPKGYYMSNVGVGAAPQQPQQPQAPQGFAPAPGFPGAPQAPQGFAPGGYPGTGAPQGFAPGAPAGWTPPGAPQAPQGAPQGVPQGYAPQGAPQGFAPQGYPAQNGTPPAAPLPWAQPPQGGQAPQAEAGAGGGRGRKAKS